ncbi:hypothetical protein H1R20_g14760, partial [Candolleomyces eurysporus]
MFAKGQRFEKPVVSDTPGPTDYNPQEPNFDSYKRDRYAILQRKVEELERVHLEGKKTHQAEVERLKSELAKHQKQQMESTELIEKQKKLNSLLEARIQDLKRTTSSEQTEVKELRSKLRLLEAERNRLQLDSSGVQELKASLHSLEAKRREELRERDTRISELERSLAAEKKARETLSRQHQQLKESSESESKSTTKKLQTLLDQKVGEVTKLQHDLARVQETTTSREEELVSQLEQHKTLLSNVASQFGRLASESVRRSSYEELQAKQNVTQLQKLKLERKLANAESQVTELVSFIRQVQESNSLLSCQLEDMVQEVNFVRQHNADNVRDSSPELHTLLSLQRSLHDDEVRLSQINEKTAELLASFYQIHSTNFAITSSLLTSELTLTDLIADQHANHLSETLASHEAIASRLETIGKEYVKLQESVGRAHSEKEAVERDLRSLNLKMEAQEAVLNEVESKHRLALRKERDTIQRLTGTTQKHRMAEDALRQEIDKLSTDVANLECYEQAYEQLSKQIASLIARNKIAEEEATQLSQCNAEILGHHNPAQRIMYVDRIRRELAEAKQTIAELRLEKERAEAQGGQLQQELQMYTSIMVPAANKPRTNMTRVTRVPLTNMTENLNHSALPAKSVAQKVQEEVYASPIADLTIDELM